MIHYFHIHDLEKEYVKAHSFIKNEVLFQIQTDCKGIPAQKEYKKGDYKTMSLNSTPSADRVHIGIFGRRNAGKSSIINAITGQNLAIVSDTDEYMGTVSLNGASPTRSCRDH